MNRITAQDMTNSQNAVRRLIIILLSFLSWLIIRASICSPYGKNLAEPCYDQKDDQFAKYCHVTLKLRSHLVFWCLLMQLTFSNSYFKILVKPHYEGNDDQFPKHCQTPRNHPFQEVFCC